MDEIFAHIEQGRWYLRGHIADVTAISHVACLLEQTKDPRRDSAKIGVVRRVWGEKIPDDDDVVDVDEIPGVTFGTFSIYTVDEPIQGMFPVTVVHDIEWLSEVNRMLREAGYEATDA